MAIGTRLDLWYIAIVLTLHRIEVERTLLSFPPDARSWWSGDHLSPQTSWVCPVSLRVGVRGKRGSHCRMLWSRLPEQRKSPFQEREPV